MKTQTLGAYCAPQATPLIKRLLADYGATREIAQAGSGDVVYSIITKKKLRIRFCTKKSVEGNDYVNWCKVFGPDELVDKFLEMVGYQPAEKKVEQLTFNFK